MNFYNFKINGSDNFVYVQCMSALFHNSKIYKVPNDPKICGEEALGGIRLC